jgi:hypothetical protein
MRKKRRGPKEKKKEWKFPGFCSYVVGDVAFITVFQHDCEISSD